MNPTPNSITTPSPIPRPDPVLAALQRIERRLDEVERVTRALAPLAEVVGQAPGGVAMLTDTFDTLAARAAEAGVDLDDRLGSALQALAVSTSPRAVHGLQTLVESHLLEPETLAIVNKLGTALAHPDDPRPVGVWGALRALRDPDVQRALGFLLAVARAFGRNLEERP